MSTFFNFLKNNRTTALLFIAVVLQYTNGNCQNNVIDIEGLLKADIDILSKKSKIDSLLSIANPQKRKELTFTASIYFYENQNLSEAIYYGDLNLKSITNHKPVDTLSYRRSLCNLGLFNYDNGAPEISEQYYRGVLEEKKNDKYQGRSAFWLGIIHQDYGDYYRALDYYETAKEAYKKSNDYNGEVNTAVRIAELYLNIEGNKNIEKGKRLLLDILNSEDINSVQQNTLQNIHQVLGGLYDQEIEGDPYQSEFHYLKALEIAKDRNDEFAAIGIHNNIGHLYLKHDLDKAFKYLTEGIDKTEFHWVKAMFLHNLGVYYYKSGNISRAIQHLKLSIIYYLNLPETTDILEIPISEFELSYFKGELLNALIFLIDYDNQLKNSLKDFDSTYRYITIAEKLIDFMRFESDSQESRLYWQEQASDLFHKATKTAFLSGKTENAFYYMEQSKAILLLKDITDREIKRNSKLSEIVIEKERVLKSNIYELQDLYFESGSSAKDSLKQILIASKIEYHNFINDLKKDYPQYYDYKTNLKIISLKEVQNALGDNEIIVEYLVNQDQGFVVLIDKRESYFYELSDIKKLELLISNFQSALHRPFVNNEDFTNYEKNAFHLFNVLFPFKNSSAFFKNKKVTIIPDSRLYNMSFEALVTTDQKSIPESYFIYNTEINYAYSLSFLKNNHDISRSGNKGFVGFAPVNFDYDTSLTSLYDSQSEIESALQFFPGLVFTEEAATKNNFLENMQLAEIIHLSTHANATDSITPWIAFKDEKLTLNELYTTKNNAELVMLSACNSALGKLNQGEGVMSLARGFFYTGANSVISSLWNVDNKSSVYISSKFYEYLSDGDSKSSSLRKAKLKYIQHHSHSELSPYYWSSLILIGDSSPIKENSGFMSYLFIGLILFLIVLIFIYRFKK